MRARKFSLILWLLPGLAVWVLPLGGFGQSSVPSTRTLAGPLLAEATVKPGDIIPGDLVVYSETGEKKFLPEVVAGKYTVLVSGCLTCPVFHRTYPGVEAVFQDYRKNEQVQFFYLYKSLAHPEYNGYIQPMNLEERLAHIVEAKRVLDTRLNWLCDGMDNTVRHTLGFGPNTQMILNPQGLIVHALGWSDADVLRAELVKLVGESDTHTDVSDLTIRKRSPALALKTVRQSHLSRPQFDTTLVPIQATPKEAGNHPLYVKPRIEVEPSVLERGRGEMYLGFHLDPIHHVHWNNLAAPLQFELNLPQGVYMTPKSAEALPVEADSDASPREFVIEITGTEPGAVFDLSFHYFACSDEEGWCLPVTQTYTVTLAVDPDGGGAMGRSFGRSGDRQGSEPRGRRGPEGRRPAERNSGQIKERILQSDTDGDGKISRSEAPDPMQRHFAQSDLDGDGYLSEDEIDTLVSALPSRGVRRRPGGPGQGGSGGDPGELLNFDHNGDGAVTREELPETMRARFGRMDENGDGVIDQEEINALAERFGGRQGRPQPRRAQPPTPPDREKI